MKPRLDTRRLTARLLLVGTDHRDRHGFRRTVRLLFEEQPDLVLVELSPYGLDYRRTHQRALHRTLVEGLRWACATAGIGLRHALRHPEIAAIRRQISIPFEYRAARSYASHTGARVVLVDDSEFSERCIADWDELIGRENLAILLNLPSGSKPNRGCHFEDLQGRTSSHCNAREGNGLESSDLEDQRKSREQFLADRILAELNRLAPSKPLYLGGWQHLSPIEEPPSLRALLGVHASRCRRLESFGRATGHGRVFRERGD